MATKTTKAKQYEKIDEIGLTIHSTFNNTIITASAFRSGKVLAWISSGAAGFKNTRKGTPYAATTAMKSLLEKIAPFQGETLYVKVSGAGNGRDAALRAISGTPYKIAKIQDVTPLPHNGCRPKKARRV